MTDILNKYISRDLNSMNDNAKGNIKTKKLAKRRNMLYKLTSKSITSIGERIK